MDIKRNKLAETKKMEKNKTKTKTLMFYYGAQRAVKMSSSKVEQKYLCKCEHF